MKRKLIRVAASPISLDLLLKGQLNYLNGFFDVLAVASPGAEHARIRRREGVETVEQMNALQQMQCDEMQGYFFGRPMEVDEATALARGQLRQPMG